MFRSVRLPRLLCAIVAGGLCSSAIGFANLSGPAQAQTQTQNSSASSDNGSAGREKIDAQLHQLKAAAEADELAAQSRISTTTMPLATDFDSETHALREHLKKMRELAFDYHLTDSPAQTKALQGEWIKMLQTGREIHQRMVDAAMKNYQANPDPKSKIADFLYQVAARNADVDRFDGMLDVVKALDKSGYSAPQFHLCFGLTAAAHNEFELARPHLEIAIKNLEKAGEELAAKADVPDEDRQATLKKMADLHGLLGELNNVEYYQPLWEDEQQRQQADRSGQPLPRVRIETTKGTFEVELFEDQSPNTVANFISLCEQNFYDGLPFHRVLAHFMAQGGCPNRDGTGGPGYTIPTELGDNPRNFFRGSLGMALSAQPDSGGSQFFICYMPRAYLNGKYVAFGRVIEGMNVLSDLVHVNPEDKEKGEHVHAPPDEIISTQVVRKRDHPYEPQKVPQSK